MNHRNMKHLFDTLSPDQNQLNKMKANIRERAVPRRNVRLHPIPIIAAILILTAGITAVSASPALRQWFFPGIGVVNVEDGTAEPLYMMLDNTSGDNARYTTAYGFWLEGTVQFWIKSTVRYDEMDTHELIPYPDAELSLIEVTQVATNSTMCGMYQIKIPNISSKQATEGIVFDGKAVKFSGMPAQYRKYTTEQCGMRLTLIPLTDDLTTFAVELEYADGRGSVTPVGNFYVVDRNEKFFQLKRIGKTNIFTADITPSAEIVRFVSKSITFSSFFPDTPVVVPIELPQPGKVVTLNQEFTVPDGVTQGMITAVGYNNPMGAYDKETLEQNFPQGYLLFSTSTREQNGIKYEYNINYSTEYYAFLEPHLVIESRSPYDGELPFEPMAPRIMMRTAGDEAYTCFHYLPDGSDTFDAVINYYSAQASGDWNITFENEYQNTPA